jgi:Uma2 family endonuclease
MAVTARTQRRGTVLSYRDYWLAPNDGQRYEIIDGELYVSPSPFPIHQRVSRNLFRILDAHVTRRGLGEVFYAPIAVVLNKRSTVEPDLVFLASDHADFVQEKAIFGAPDLLVEVLSPSSGSQDRVIKKGLYERSGVAHYWIVDPRKQVLQAFRLDGGAYVLETEVTGRRTFRPSLFPGLTVRLADVWAETAG